MEYPKYYKEVQDRANQIHEESNKILAEAQKMLSDEELEGILPQSIVNAFIYTKLAELDIKMEQILKEVQKKKNF